MHSLLAIIYLKANLTKNKNNGCENLVYQFVGLIDFDELSVNLENL
jgi:hypothetical protein